MKRYISAILAALLLVLLTGCGSNEDSNRISLDGTQLEITASSEFFNTIGEHVMTYSLGKAVLQDDGDIVFVHTFTNHSDYRVTFIVCEFIYYTADGSVMAHKQLTKSLVETPVEAGGTYTYYSTNNFGGAVPYTMEACITRADTEFETPILPKPSEDSALFTFFTDGRYTGLVRAFASVPPAALMYTDPSGGTITVTDAASIKSVYEAMCAVQVGTVSGSSSDGKDRVYTFIMSDGTEYTVAFEGSSLIRYGDSLYSVSGTASLYSLVLKDGEYSQQSGDDYERGQVD